MRFPSCSRFTPKATARCLRTWTTCTNTSDDPRPQLAERLIEALEREGTICTYSGYERQVLRALARALPEQAEALDAIESRLFDLLPVVRNAYYHPDFRGSFSIKNVLPALVPGMGYDDLAVADGQTAAVRYALALASTNHHRSANALSTTCAPTAPATPWRW